MNMVNQHPFLSPLDKKFLSNLFPSHRLTLFVCILERKSHDMDEDKPFLLYVYIDH
ncbi:hypothetical protein B4119_2299 [Parageobacillus caldoxylosilyticus]|uniref:Uncharacterized protein n=1 Tax=Saccharococcus caldoxylosilyticus TaxID=81408 RepID=A0A150LJ83_9BACL|nr:hypothetical protein B4119_2299 [Parageobacillus caldoxylosilyticus]